MVSVCSRPVAIADATIGPTVPATIVPAGVRTVSVVPVRTVKARARKGPSQSYRWRTIRSVVSYTRGETSPPITDVLDDVSGDDNEPEDRRVDDTPTPVIADPGLGTWKQSFRMRNARWKGVYNGATVLRRAV